MNLQDVPFHLVEKAVRILRGALGSDIYVEEEWYILDDNYELKIDMKPGTDQIRTAIYPVRYDGSTLLDDSSAELNLLHKFVSTGRRQWRCRGCGKVYENRILVDDLTICQGAWDRLKGALNGAN